MALTVRDVLQLQALQNFKLVAGKEGLDRFISMTEILDFEFAEGVTYHRDVNFNKDSFVISSLLFAKEKPELILPALRALVADGISVFAYKDIIIDTLPQEVLDYCNKHNLATFRFDDSVYFENIVFQVMDAIQTDDTAIMNESKIHNMIDNQLSRSDINAIARTLSLDFKPYAMVAYIKGPLTTDPKALSRLFKNFYLSKSLNEKAMLCRYNNGFFAIITSTGTDKKPYEVVLSSILDYCNIDCDEFVITKSDVHSSYEALDLCLRESYHSSIAAQVLSRSTIDYSEIGTLKFLIPLNGKNELDLFASDILNNIDDDEDLLSTATTYVMCQGDINETAEKLICHPNTARYRIHRIKELSGKLDLSDFAFYEELSIAVKLFLLNRM